MSSKVCQHTTGRQFKWYKWEPGLSENVVTVTMQDAGVQTNDDSVIQPVQRTIADEVDETSKALELPADDDDDSDCGSDFEFSHDI